MKKPQNCDLFAFVPTRSLRARAVGKLVLAKVACIVFLFCAAGANAAPPKTQFRDLLNFDWTDSAYPMAALIQAKDGNFYGTTYGGIKEGGTIFRITAKGRLKTLHSFNGADGSHPVAGLIQATDDNFYGTTYYGGASHAQPCVPYGCGTVLKITAAGELTTLYSFCSQGGSSCTDGYFPTAGLVQARDGNFYGTTAAGGAIDTQPCSTGCGTAFKVTPAGQLITLYSFCSQGGSSCTDGAVPVAGLVQGSDGNFYGATGGINGKYCTVFRITSEGTLTTLHTFNGNDGDEPVAALIQATDGNFYGTTLTGGANGYGTVFSITPGGVLTTLHSFDSTDGAYPNAGVIQATDGNFYGTTDNEGVDRCFHDCGTVFKITAEGTLTTLHRFSTGGKIPLAGLVQATSGDLYGTTVGGGYTSGNCHPGFFTRHGCGTVFRLSVGLGGGVRGRSKITKLARVVPAGCPASTPASSPFLQNARVTTYRHRGVAVRCNPNTHKHLSTFVHT